METEIEIERIAAFIRNAMKAADATGVVVGLSGGVDGAVAAALCGRALGGDRVLGLSLPSAITPPGDIADAADLCSRFGMHHTTMSIVPMLDAFTGMPAYESSRYLNGNLMARIRMTVLYYHANRTGSLVCGTSNRSEYMLGYCTKYGDNAADLQPILHLYKTEVYAIAEALDIPRAIREKPPSAGLWAGQTDEEDLGLTYEEIDRALKALEANQWRASSEIEEKVRERVNASRHKREPAPSLLTDTP